MLRFYIRRITRIAPLLIAAIALGLLFREAWPWHDAAYDAAFSVPGANYPWMFWASIGTFSFNWYRLLDTGATSGWFGLQWDILWSLAVEEQFYILFPLLINIIKRERLIIRLLIGAVVASTLLRAVLITTGFGWMTVLTNSFTCFDSLAIGVIVALAPRWGRVARVGAAGIGMVLMIICYFAGYAPLLGSPVLGMAIGTALSIQSSRSNESWQKDVNLRVPLITEIGMLSYGAYLLHPFAFIIAAPLILAGWVNPAIGFLAAVLGTYIIAKISFVMFERPVEKSSRKRLYLIVGVENSMLKVVGEADANVIC